MPLQQESSRSIKSAVAASMSRCHLRWQASVCLAITSTWHAWMGGIDKNGVESGTAHPCHQLRVCCHLCLCVKCVVRVCVALCCLQNVCASPSHDDLQPILSCKVMTKTTCGGKEPSELLLDDEREQHICVLSFLTGPLTPSLNVLMHRILPPEQYPRWPRGVCCVFTGKMCLLAHLTRPTAHSPPPHPCFVGVKQGTLTLHGRFMLRGTRLSNTQGGQRG